MSNSEFLETYFSHSSLVYYLGLLKAYLVFSALNTNMTSWFTRRFVCINKARLKLLRNVHKLRKQFSSANII